MQKLHVAAIGVLALVAIVALGTIAGAGDDVPQRPNRDAKAAKITDEAKAVADVAMAHALAEYGRREQDPLALLTAAKILKTIPLKKMEGTPVTHREEGVKPEEKPEPGIVPMSADALIKEALDFAGGDSTLMGVASLVEGAKTRGVQGGAECGTSRLEARSIDTFTATFVGGELARVGLRGDGDTDLDLHIFDENDNLIVSDTDNTDACLCEWTPRWTGVFKIKVSNLGRVWNQYRICTN